MEVSGRIVRLRLAETFVIAREEQDWAEVVQVEVGHDGETGRGEAAPIARYDESAESALAFVEAHGGLLGDDPFALEEIGARLAETPGEHAAKAALDAALHDLQGRLTGHRRGGFSGCAARAADVLDGLARRPRRNGAQGGARRTRRSLPAAEAEAGGGDGLDVQRVPAVRSVTHLPLQVDVNEWWSLDEALEAIPQLAELGVQYVEQPLRAGDEGGGVLREAVAAADLRRRGLSYARGRRPMRRHRARHHDQAREVGRDPRGDPDGARCARLGLGVMLGCMIESGLGIAAGCCVAPLCDHVDLDGNLLLADDPCPGVELVEGVQLPTERPGLGV